MVDWSPFLSKDYSKVIKGCISFVAHIIAQFIDDLMHYLSINLNERENYNAFLSRISIAGNRFSAHIAGKVGFIFNKITTLTGSIGVIYGNIALFLIR